VEKDFSRIKTEFLSAFASTLSCNEVDDIEHVYHLRNMIGHAHVSIARNYMLFRPGGKNVNRRSSAHSKQNRSLTNQTL